MCVLLVGAYVGKTAAAGVGGTHRKAPTQQNTHRCRCRWPHGVDAKEGVRSVCVGTECEVCLLSAQEGSASQGVG